MKWTTFKLVGKRAKRHPSGKECYPCLNVRRRHFTKKEHGKSIVLSQAELNEKRKESQELDDKCCETRADMVSGANEFRHLGEIDLKIYTEKKDTAFNRRFNPSTFYPIYQFAKERRLEYEGEDDLCDQIAERFSTNMIAWRRWVVTGNT